MWTLKPDKLNRDLVTQLIAETIPVSNHVVFIQLPVKTNTNMEPEGGGPGASDSANLESNSAKSDDPEDDKKDETEKKNGSEKKDENPENNDNIDSASDQDSKMKVVNQEVKLCGWLLIFSRGIINTNRSRWFVFGDNTCKLYYYRNTHDLIPLGEIDISHASFHFDASNTDKPGSFEIRYLS